MIRKTFSRRTFLLGTGAAGAGGATLAFTVGLPVKTPFGTIRGLTPNIWVAIGTDGVVTIVCPAAELGQGASTALPMVLAEELDVDWSKVRVVAPPFDHAYGNPKFFDRFVTADSRSTAGYWEPLRSAGAEARAVLLETAARHWGVPSAALTTEPGVVVDTHRKRRLDYGAVAALDPVSPKGPAPLKPPEAWRLIGTSPERLDLADKVTGRARYGIDVRMEGLRIASVARGPVPGSVPAAVDERAARAVPGVETVVLLPDGVAVVACDTWAAEQGRDALSVTWSDGGKAAGYDSDAALGSFAAVARDPARRGYEARRTGDVAAAFAGAARVFEAEFASHHVAHAAMEPMNATARVHTMGLGVDVIAPTQARSLDMRLAARAAKTAPFMIDVTGTLVGGGFGRRVDNDAARDAVLIAKATGTPVKVVRRHADDLTHGQYRPLAAQRLRAALDAQGRIVGWSHRIVADSVIARLFPDRFEDEKHLDQTVIDGQEHQYAIPNQHLDYVREDTGIPVGFLRGVGGGFTVWAIECFLDEIAAATGRDPLEFRLGMLPDAQARRVLAEAATMAGWGSRPKGAPLGLACCRFRGAHIALVVEVDIGRGGALRVPRVWAAVDTGVAVHPDAVRAQVEGAVVMGVSMALREAVVFRNGVPQVDSLADYPILGPRDAPDVAVRLVSSGAARPTGAGEIGVPPTAPAIANAVFAATGRRLRQLPFAGALATPRSACAGNAC
ncbi:MAG TPA: molybdopterin cofactor-binding domain-containing protein [Azospirillum sp.]|nr:molybdopterin cofactor-binding domain-containing protein [Azospirillum sp.]